MSVLAFDVGARFIMTVRKSLFAAPDQRWVNRYEIVANIAGEIGDLEGVRDTFLDGEKALHYDVVNIEQAEMATWEPDSVPYDPTTFVTWAVNLAGEREPGSASVLDLGVCMLLRRQSVSGRNGVFALRGGLTDEYAISDRGRYVLSEAGITDMETALGVWRTRMSEYLSGSGEFSIVMISNDGESVRQVSDFVRGKISWIPRDHRWYNRGGGGGAPVGPVTAQTRFSITPKGVQAITKQ